MSSYDFMAIGAHPDDVEIMAGGTVAKLVREFSRKGILVDLSDGAAGTRGNSEIREKEAREAAQVLQVDRIQLGLPDAGLFNSWEFQKPIVEAIRKYRPKIILTHAPLDDHSDHRAANQLVYDAWYKSGLKKLELIGEAFRPSRMFYFLGPVESRPDFCVDISDYWDVKKEALLCYKSQFHNEEAKKFEGKTDISSPEFMDFLEIRARYFGSRIKRKYAEPFLCHELPEMGDLTDLGTARFG